MKGYLRKEEKVFPALICTLDEIGHRQNMDDQVIQQSAPT